VRAMILAAGLGTRMRPLTDLCAKPALPVRGRPLIGWLLAWLQHHGVREVLVNLHHRPESLRRAVADFLPTGMRVVYSEESEPLGTGGGIRRAADFLRESDPSVVLAGDMLFDADLGALVEHHRERRAACTLVLRRDPRSETFGSIGIDARDRLRRISRRFDLGGEQRAGVFVGVRLLSADLLDSLPDRESFEDLSDWLAPLLAAGADDILGTLLEAADCAWEPVGTPAEYLAVNLAPPRLSYLDPTGTGATSGVPPGTQVLGTNADLILGAGARLGAGAILERSVVWAGEQVPAGFRGTGGVFAGGSFYSCSHSVRKGDGKPEAG